ncbi:MAG: LCP family protein [Bifidobacterium scardovii]|uniref:LCP family protein n=1 Tax=Bifidobacterium scardovii TaxID=158787 RepID=UPI0006655D32|nr:LCP family protein [Bifidobacterium scardovii]MBS6948230.1 LCP family protein [Bifidobacterium scardovii]MDU3736160.1 LCP family protein [Bifidobacterium scardovii]MDU5296738.1 LCP family protein [Bifidobacterium scardovii]MDU5610194.1 LCP family protein [Bifidobacterium scardovii]MDU5887814.1 LCP family protein [Bifidobacterium scardovii]
MVDGNGGATPSTPPSFIPSAQRRRASRAGNAAQASGIEPSSSEARPSQHAESAPPAFAPSSGRRSRTSQSRQSGAAGTGAPASPAAQPQSFAPAAVPDRQPRRSSGSSRTASPAPASYTAASRRERLQSRQFSPSHQSNAAAHPQAGPGNGQAVSGGTPAIALRGPGRGAGRSARRHRPLRVLLITLALLVAVGVISVFGAWNWVNGHLVKSDWLTDMANTKGTSWLLLGSDERDGTEGVAGSDASDITGSRTDTILVLTKPKSGHSSLISIPRDSLMNVDGQYMKINAVSQFYGDKALVGQVESLSGQKIDHVAEIRFGGLKNVVDAIGGVELCYDQDVSDGYSGLEWKSGCHMADGTTALAFSRMRYADAQGDFGRAARQRQVIGAVMKKALSGGTLLNFPKVGKLANAALASITVDEKTNPYTLLQMALAFRDATGSNGVSGSVYWSNPDYYVDGVGSSVLLDDAKNKELFSQLASGTHKAGDVGTLAEEG